MSCAQTDTAILREGVTKALLPPRGALAFTAASRLFKSLGAAVLLSLMLLDPLSLGSPTRSLAQDEPSSAEAAEHYDQGRVAEAVVIYRTLARQGHVGAQVSLAGLYAGGEVTGERNYVRAVQWYRAAALQGDAVAQLNLGDFYARGLGVEREFVEAWVWLSLAAEQGRSWAERRREDIAPRLSDEDLQRAKQLLAERRP